jgi:hypothetical protein
MALLFQEHESPYHESVAWKLLIEKRTRALIGIQPSPCYVMNTMCYAGGQLDLLGNGKWIPSNSADFVVRSGISSHGSYIGCTITTSAKDISDLRNSKQFYVFRRSYASCNPIQLAFRRLRR